MPVKVVTKTGYKWRRRGEGWQQPKPGPGGSAAGNGGAETGFEVKQNHPELLRVEGTWSCWKVFLFAKGIQKQGLGLVVGVCGFPKPHAARLDDNGCPDVVVRGEAAQVAPRR